MRAAWIDGCRHHRIGWIGNEIFSEFRVNLPHMRAPGSHFWNRKW